MGTTVRGPRAPDALRHAARAAIALRGITARLGAARRPRAAAAMTSAAAVWFAIFGARAFRAKVAVPLPTAWLPKCMWKRFAISEAMPVSSIFSAGQDVLA